MTNREETIETSYFRIAVRWGTLIAFKFFMYIIKAQKKYKTHIVYGENYYQNVLIKMLNIYYIIKYMYLVKINFQVSTQFPIFEFILKILVWYRKFFTFA